MKRTIGSNQHRNRYALKKDVVMSLLRLLFVTIFIILALQAVRYYRRIAYYEWRDRNVIASPCANFCNFAGKVQAYEEIDDEPTVKNITNYILDIKHWGKEKRTEQVRALHCFISESGLRPEAYNFNTNKTSDYNIPQINSIHTVRFGTKFMTDWKASIDVAYQLYKEQGWNPWYGSGCK